MDSRELMESETEDGDHTGEQYSIMGREGESNNIDYLGKISDISGER